MNTRAIFEDGRREAGAEPWMYAFHQLEFLPPHASVMTLFYHGRCSLAGVRKLHGLRVCKSSAREAPQGFTTQDPDVPSSYRGFCFRHLHRFHRPPACRRTLIPLAGKIRKSADWRLHTWHLHPLRAPILPTF